MSETRLLGKYCKLITVYTLMYPFFIFDVRHIFQITDISLFRVVVTSGTRNALFRRIRTVHYDGMNG